MAQRILFATGGSGGHVYPVISIIQAIQKQNSLVEIELIGSGKFLIEAAKEAGLPLHLIWSAKARRYFSFLNILDFLKLPVVFLQSLYLVWRFMPDVVFAKGGGASFMPALVAKLLFIPLYIHETDVIPGAANRQLGHLANKVFISFEQSKAYFKPNKVQLVGHPIRTELLNGNRDEALTFFKLANNKPTILITGGSQGALNINRLIQESLVELVKEFQIIHLTGDETYQSTDAFVKQLEKEGEKSYGQEVAANYRYYSFLHAKEMALAYALCDVIVSRSGSAVFELTALAKPVILIPLANSASGHQAANAQVLAQFGATVIIERNLTEHIFLQELRDSYRDRATLGQRLLTFARPDAAEIIARLLLNSSI